MKVSETPVSNVHFYKRLGMAVINGSVYCLARCSEYLLRFDNMTNFKLTTHSVTPVHTVSFVTFNAKFPEIFGHHEVGCAMLLERWRGGRSVLSWILMLQRRVRWRLAQPRRLCAAMALHPRLGRYAAMGGLGEDLVKLVCTKL